ncbi:MAG: hypothetical protein ACJA0Q_002271 [Saprospiraceae bacterium]|jgi:hypothetical protein
MKKLLLSVALLATIGVNAQDCVSATGFTEDFVDAAKAEDTDAREIGWWGEQTIYSYTRSGGGDLAVSTTKAAGGTSTWTPFGFSLTNPDPSDKTVDISADAKITVSYTNSSSNTVEVYWLFASKVNKTATAKFVLADAVGTSFGGIIAAGATADLTFDLGTGTRTSWDYLSEAACITGSGVASVTYAAGKCIWNDGFDATNLASVDITITGEATAASSWAPGALTGETVTFHSIKSATACVSSGIADLVSTGGNVYPNPANEVVNVDLGSATNATVELSDVTGKVVASASAASGVVSLNTSNVPAGLYVVSVKSDSGVSTSKVVVK